MLRCVDGTLGVDSTGSDGDKGKAGVSLRAPNLLSRELGAIISSFLNKCSRDSIVKQMSDAAANGPLVYVRRLEIGTYTRIS